MKSQLAEKDREIEKKIREASAKSSASQSALTSSVNSLSAQMETLTMEVRLWSNSQIFRDSLITTFSSLVPHAEHQVQV